MWFEWSESPPQSPGGRSAREQEINMGKESKSKNQNGERLLFRHQCWTAHPQQCSTAAVPSVAHPPQLLCSSTIYATVPSVKQQYHHAAVSSVQQQYHVVSCQRASAHIGASSQGWSIHGSSAQEHQVAVDATLWSTSMGLINSDQYSNDYDLKWCLIFLDCILMKIIVNTDFKKYI